MTGDEAPRPSDAVDKPQKQARFQVMSGIFLAGTAVTLAVSVGLWHRSTQPGIDSQAIYSAIRSQEVKSAAITDDGHDIELRLASGSTLRSSTAKDTSDAFVHDLIAAGIYPARLVHKRRWYERPLFPLPFAPTIGVLLPILLLGAPAILLLALGLEDRAKTRASSAAMGRRTFAGLGPSAGANVQAPPPVERPDVSLSDFAGPEELIDELTVIVEFLTNPAPFARYKATMPRGVLLVGPPGVGKTLLARAVAGEASAAFYAVSGTDFVEMWVGLGAARIRTLFKEAHAHPPAVIFIDEIDSIARSRSTAITAGQQEYDHTLNALLVEMDGFHKGDGVVVLAATNRPELLDQALLRPGRFDRKVTLPLPDIDARRAILERHLARVGPSDVSHAAFASSAQRTAGLSGADLANIVNEAAIRAARRSANALSDADLDEALRVARAGPELRSRRVSESDRRVVAWHEAGHTLCALLEPNAQKPETVSIVSRSGLGGATWMIPREGHLTRSGALADLVVLMGGRAGEEKLLAGDFTAGSTADLATATDLAEKLVHEFGMGKSLTFRDRYRVSSTAIPLVDIEELLAAALATARMHMTAHVASLDLLAGTLLERERLAIGDIELFAEQHLRAASHDLEPDSIPSRHVQ